MQVTRMGLGRGKSKGNDPEEPRLLYINNHEANSEYKFAGNKISTTKYSILSYIPKGLFEQFRRVANVYFAFLAALSLTPISPLSPVTTIMPLVFVIAVSMGKEGFEDFRRRKNDNQINRSKVDVHRDGEWKSISWAHVVVGDIVRVMGKHQFPADLLFLSSSHEEGICYIETMNLDGETNLKIKKSLDQTRTLDLAGYKACKARIECEQPNNHLYTFTGNLILGDVTLPLSTSQILLRGCSLRNTDFILGAVIFSGHETKVMKNSMAAPSKRSTLEKKMDILVYLLFIVLAAMCLVGALGTGIFIDFKYWYLGLRDVDIIFDPKTPIVVGVLNFFTLFTLYGSIIPISLYVSVEMIKVIQVTQFINKDKRMYDEVSGTPALARTSNLNEELGQIQFVFSDKTGTLTQNLMEFYKCSIAGKVYGHGVTEIEQVAAARAGLKVPTYTPSSDAEFERGFSFDDPLLTKGRWAKLPERAIIQEFFRVMAVCHTVIPDGPDDPNQIVYEASSPDESALVTAAKKFGFFFYKRTLQSVFVREMYDANGKYAPRDVEFDILNVLEFNSTRKRQSVICRHPEDGRILLYCKGADTMIFERLAEKGNSYKYVTSEQLTEFGNNGLRTLCLAYAELDPAEYAAWDKKYQEARNSLQDRAAKLDAVAELIEKDLILVGCTAIEDKLQVGVPNCIEELHRCGIKVWVLTGDKVETAINIGYACSLLDNDQHMILFDSDAEGIKAAEEQDKAKASENSTVGSGGGPPRPSHRNMNSAVATYIRGELAKHLEKVQQIIQSGGGNLSLVADGKMLVYLMNPALADDFLKLALQCTAVLCCRVSPLQKAEITSLVRRKAKQITLAIGDGANDVGMIQAAHIGVGISGQEGMQAVMASDFAIAQFRFLSVLLLVHGRWSYRRISLVVGYFFYKNIAMVTCIFWFNMYTGFSGQRLFDDWFQSLYNLIFTALPTIFLGVLEQDIPARVALENPEVYGAGKEVLFSWRVLLYWVISAVYQSCICFFLVVYPLGHAAVFENGQMICLWTVGTAVYTSVIITVNLRILMLAAHQSLPFQLITWLSVGVWFGYVCVYCALKPGLAQELDRQDNVYFLIYKLFETPAFWFLMLFVPTTCLLPDVIYQGGWRWFKPEDYHILQEREKRKEVERAEAGEERGGCLGIRERMWAPTGLTASRPGTATGPTPSAAISRGPASGALPIPLHSPCSRSGFAFQEPFAGVSTQSMDGAGADDGEAYGSYDVMRECMRKTVLATSVTNHWVQATAVSKSVHGGAAPAGAGSTTDPPGAKNGLAVPPPPIQGGDLPGGAGSRHGLPGDSEIRLPGHPSERSPVKSSPREPAPFSPTRGGGFPK
eukprot:jgi/Mesvir1/10640/Mv13736-RA.1